MSHIHLHLFIYLSSCYSIGFHCDLTVTIAFNHVTPDWCHFPLICSSSCYKTTYIFNDKINKANKQKLVDSIVENMSDYEPNSRLQVDCSNCLSINSWMMRENIAVVSIYKTKNLERMLFCSKKIWFVSKFRIK